MKTLASAPNFVIDRVYMDTNGNKSIKIITTGSNIKLKIQTNGNLPITHREAKIGDDGIVLSADAIKEINEYIQDYFNGFK